MNKICYGKLALLSIAKGSDIVLSLSLKERYSASLMRSDAVRLC